jgi:hypothetical protein
MRTLLIIPAIVAIVASKHDASDVKTLSVGLNALAKASKAFDGIDENSKRAAFASVASAARVTYDDAARIAETYASKGSTLREALKALRKSTVLRIMDASIVHDAAEDAASVVTIDKMVSNLDTIGKHLSSIVRLAPVHTCAEAG